MKEYLVESDCGKYSNIFIVSAKDSKDAIDQVWSKYNKRKD